jgi:hypothetical protein
VPFKNSRLHLQAAERVGGTRRARAQMGRDMFCPHFRTVPHQVGRAIELDAQAPARGETGMINTREVQGSVSATGKIWESSTVETQLRKAHN